MFPWLWVYGLLVLGFECLGSCGFSALGFGIIQGNVGFNCESAPVMEKQVDHQMECEIDAYSLRTDRPQKGPPC